MKKLPVTILMPTLNAEAHLAEALGSCLDCVEDFFIVDSRSTDRTVDIALEHGIKVCQKEFITYGAHIRWFTQTMPIRTPWVFIMDQDERFSESLKASLYALFEGEPSCNAYQVPWRLWFMGRPLHVVAPMTRLLRKGCFTVSDVICNEQILVEGETGCLDGILEHKDSLDLHLWNEKQNLYSTMEAIAICRDKGRFSCTPRLFGSALERRMWLKKVFFQIPGRYQILFLYNFLLQGAWRDGKTGWIWSHLRSEVYRMWELKALEMRTTGRIPAIPQAAHGDYDPRIMRSAFQRSVLPELVAEWEARQPHAAASR